MKKLLLLLPLALSMADKPHFQASPHFTTEPAVIVLLVTHIPAGIVTACFVLEGDTIYSGCQEVHGRQSIRIEYKNVRAGQYVAAASLDTKIVGQVPIHVTGINEPEDINGEF